MDEPVIGGREGAAARISTGVFTTRYAGATLLYPFFGLADAEAVLAAVGAKPAGWAGGRFDDLAVLTATSVCFGLGFASLEQAKHPDRAQVGPVAGIDVLPELRTLRPRLAAIADACDPLAVQRSLAEAMLRAEPNLSGVYFVDERFMPYSGAKPVGSGWNTKRRHAEPGRVDTTISDPKGRAVCFTSGEPSSLAKSMPAAPRPTSGQQMGNLPGAPFGGCEQRLVAVVGNAVPRRCGRIWSVLQPAGTVSAAGEKGRRRRDQR